MVAFSFSGVDFDTDTFTGYGYLTPVIVNGVSYPQWTGAFVAALTDLTRAATTTSVTSKNASLTGTQSWVMAAEVPFSIGATVVIARTSAPTTVRYTGIVTARTGTTLTIEVGSSIGAGSGITDWSITLSGNDGATGAAGTQDNIVIDIHTSAFTAGVGDRGKCKAISSGTFIASLDDAATLGSGWWCLINNAGTGVVTVDPVGAPLINGKANYLLGQRQSATFHCTGTGFIIGLTGFDYATAPLMTSLQNTDELLVYDATAKIPKKISYDNFRLQLAAELSLLI